MGLQAKADSGATALETSDAAFPGNLLTEQPLKRQKTPTGEVQEREGNAFELSVSGERLSAQRAVSCLLEPRIGDLVALLDTEEGVFITDVLVRREGKTEQSRITVGGTRGEAQDLVIAAANLKIEASENIEAHARSMSFRFESILMAGRQLALVGTKLLTSMQDIVTNAKKQLASFETTSTRARNRVDRVDETDQLRAGSIQTQADSVALTQAGTSLIVAKEDIRLDGKRISMG
ncbi:DUF3540 domain-containing protein [Labrenzia sp. VG12]|uniref:DUF3540 domain-containing protein n=1 Tax=Labrenzia sp. VG12 TaxID=2021862 RepID=UPI0012FD9B87|nr:DUF3540 domain-containing protein [Labrenzia sp. VG12]